MTPRQRILATLAHERPDRIPTDGWFHPEIIAALKRYYCTSDWSDVETKLGIEGWGRINQKLKFGDYQQRATPRPKQAQPADGKRVATVDDLSDKEMEAAVPLDSAEGKMGIWLDDVTYEDQWGVRKRLGLGGRYEQWLSGPLENAQSVADVQAFAMPELLDYPDAAADVAKLKEQQLYVFGGVQNVFTATWHLRGYENTLMDYLAEQEMLLAMYDKFFELHTRIVLMLVRAGVDMITVVGDVSMQDRIIMGAELWRKIDKPRYAALIAAARAINKDIVFFFHSDGKLTELVDDLVEIGFTIINPIQPECMDPRMVKQRWGKRITLHGCISLQKTLPFGSTADVRAEVEGLIRDCGYDGGLILMPSNVIQPDTPLENVLTCYHAARDYRFT